MKLQRDFYLQDDVIEISKELLGKYLFTYIDHQLTGGIIIETEAYEGITDKASHAYNNKRTKRTETMFALGGISYIYLCYGIHYLFNVVTNKIDTPHAILIRAIKPVVGIETILKRRNQTKMTNKLTGGPGTTAQALGITMKQNSIDLTKDTIWIEDRGVKINKKDITITPRIRVDYAEEDELRLNRFIINL